MVPGDPGLWSRMLPFFRGRWSRVNAFTRFTAAFSVVLIALMVLLAVWINGSLVTSARDSAAEDAATFLEGMLQPFLAGPGASDVLVEDADAALKRLLPQAFLSERDVRANFALIQIWNLNGRAGLHVER